MQKISSAVFYSTLFSPPIVTHLGTRCKPQVWLTGSTNICNATSECIGGSKGIIDSVNERTRIIVINVSRQPIWMDGAEIEYRLLHLLICHVTTPSCSS
jgi:hypothetical protein